MKKLIIDNDLSQHVDLVGALSFEEVVSHYQQATVLVMPSRTCTDDIDGLPTVIIEALAMGIPVIASSIAGIPDLIKDGSTGLIVPPDDERSLAKAIKEVLVDQKLRELLTLHGRNEILKNYDISRTIQQLNNVIVLNLAKHS